MATINVNGWIAEGGYRLIEGPNGKIILFDLVENDLPCKGIEEDEFRTNNAWFHCSLEVIVEKPDKVTFIPKGYTLQKINSRGFADIVKIGKEYDWIPDFPCLYGEQAVDYIQEGKLVNVSGQEFLLKGQDGNLMRMIKVTEINFDPYWVREKPKILTVPYKSDAYIWQTPPRTNSDSK